MVGLDGHRAVILSRMTAHSVVREYTLWGRVVNDVIGRPSDHAMHMCACVAVRAGAACMGVRPSAVSVASSPSKAAEMADMFLTAIMLVHEQYVSYNIT